MDLVELSVPVTVCHPPGEGPKKHGDTQGQTSVPDI
jgi:hypothetical protein